MIREGLHYLASNEGIRRTASRNPIARHLASRFVAGESLTDALAAIRSTNQIGMKATLDELGENVRTFSDAAKAGDSYCRALDAIASQQLDANISCKLTHLGLDLGQDVAQTLVSRVVGAAAGHGNFLRIDMEGSKYTDMALEITQQAFAINPGAVGTVIQSYLYRSSDDVRALNRLGIRIRLVKGAYLEPPAIAYPQKADVDENYQRLAEMLLAEGTYPAFGTHDEALLGFIKNRAAALGRKSDEFEFQMLYGVRRDLQRQLRDEGYQMRLYIPFGTQWYPYLMRRLAERPANLLFVVGNLAREARA